MVEYQTKKSSGVAKAGLATAIAAGGLTLLNGGGIGGLGFGLGGGQQTANTAATVEMVTMLPLIAQAYGGGHNSHHDDDRYVTKEVLNLVRENAGKDAEIAELKSINYTDRAVKAATDPISNRVCSLETAAAVNAARDQDFRQFVNREFVHQPKASMNEMIVTCKPCGCKCDSDCSC